MFAIRLHWKCYLLFSFFKEFHKDGFGCLNGFNGFVSSGDRQVWTTWTGKTFSTTCAAFVYESTILVPRVLPILLCAPFCFRITAIAQKWGHQGGGNGRNVAEEKFSSFQGGGGGETPEEKFWRFQRGGLVMSQKKVS